MAEAQGAILHILVPVDFSEHSSKALDYAIALAQATGAKLDLVHAYHVPVAVQGPYSTPVPPDFTAAIRQGAEKSLAEWLERVRAAGIKGETHLVEGPPALAITDTAQSLGADHIVIGTRGLTGLKHVILGSVAERVVRFSHCPVTTVP